LLSKKPRIFFDTPVPIERAKEHIGGSGWTSAREFIAENFRYVVSPATFLELLNGIVNGSETRFQNFRGELNALIPSHGRMNFLKSPGSFVRETLLGISHPHPNFEPSDLEQWVKAVFYAKSYQEMLEGNVVFPNVTRKTFGLHPTVVLEQTLTGKQVHADQLEKVRAGELQLPNKPTWARGILVSLGQKPTHEECLKLAEGLDAAYQLFQWFGQQAKTSNYNFAKHDSDWIDEQQLYYLADPQTYFLTSDTHFVERVRGSGQAARIITYKLGAGSTLADVVKRALGSPHASTSPGD
jgi:hypothetical protein